MKKTIRQSAQLKCTDWRIVLYLSVIKYSSYQVKTKMQMHAGILIFEIYPGIVYDLIDPVKQRVSVDI